MKKDQNIQRVDEITLTVETQKNGSVTVQMRSYTAGFYEVVHATEYMMWIVASEGGLSFKKTMKNLVAGARNVSGTTVKIPRQKKRKRKEKNDNQGTNRDPLKIR